MSFSRELDALYRALERGDGSGLDDGVDVNRSNVNSGTEHLLHAAVRSQQAALVERLLHLGARVDAVESWFGHTALHEAAIGGDCKIAALLLAAGADPNVRTPYGYAPVDIAANHDHAALVALLTPLTTPPKKALRRRLQRVPSGANVAVVVVDDADALKKGSSTKRKVKKRRDTEELVE
jgi:ankyrin repeat protein